MRNRWLFITLAAVVVACSDSQSPEPSPEPVSVNIWGDAFPSDSTMHSPTAISLDKEGHLYVVDGIRRRVQKFTTEGGFISVWQVPVQNWLFIPEAVAVGHDGTIYIGDSATRTIIRIRPDGTVLPSWNEIGTTGLAVNSAGDIILAELYQPYLDSCQEDGPHVLTLAPDGTVLQRWGCSIAGIWAPREIACDAHDNVYIIYSAPTPAGIRDFMVTYSPEGEILSRWEFPFDGSDAAGLFVDKDGSIYTAVFPQHEIQRYDATGQRLLRWGSFGGTAGHLAGPSGVVVDKNGAILVSEFWNHRIQVFAYQ